MCGLTEIERQEFDNFKYRFKVGDTIIKFRTVTEIRKAKVKRGIIVRLHKKKDNIVWIKLEGNKSNEMINIKYIKKDNDNIYNQKGT